jgi:hypothetical protein
VETLPAWVWPFLSAVASAVSAWTAVKVSVVRLQTQMETVIHDTKVNTRVLAQHNDDLLTHDMEIEQALAKLDLKRARRQPLRGWER